INVARLKYVFDGEPTRHLQNPAGEGKPGTTPTLSQARNKKAGPAVPGDWGEDPGGNTWVMHKDEIRTYFRRKDIAGPNRLSAWLAKNPGNADFVKALTPRAVSSFRWGSGIHDFAVYFDEEDAKNDLRERMKDFQTIAGYVHAHLGKNKADNNNFDVYIS